MGVRIVAVLGSIGLLVVACSRGDANGSGTRADASASTTAAATSPSGSTGEVASESDDPGDGGSSTTEGPATTGSTSTTERDTDTSDTTEPTGSTTDDTGEAGQLGPGIGGVDGGLKPVGQGDSGEDVVALQDRLAEMGFAPGPSDGSYGQRTVTAVEAFQVLVGLTPTGTADASTIAALADFDYNGLVLHAGDEGPEVEELQQRLSGGPFDPGPVDGVYGTGTVEAVWALEKLAGVPVDGDWGPLDERAWEQVTGGQVGRPEKSHDQRWVEVDLSEQLVKVYDPGATTPRLVSHASSGSGIPWSNENHSGSSITPLGDFEIYNRIAGWRESSLDIGRLYNPLYFNGGIALHGSLSVPLYPASHGCIRLPMHIAEYLPGELPDGTPVHVLA